jgi:hypothetical protein
MILDGTNGTATGDGLVQCMQSQGHADVSGWYRTARMYNSGSIAANGSLECGETSTNSYASDVANRLLGWTNYQRNGYFATT